MKKAPIAFTLFLILGLMTGCSLNHRYSSLEEAQFRAAGFEPAQNIAPEADPAAHIENRVEAIPGVQEANVLFYGVDNLIIGVDAEGTPSVRAIEGWIRQELQGEANDFLVYVVTEREPDLLSRIKTMRGNILQGKRVNENEMLSLVNGVWKTIVPFNHLSKT
ncbi:YhcN/YlaJ family sporulation lipoprotein [Ammoniphilus sp. 3BR4]|uniref:YhcN/YlaJ family sporulation lipoprotein n=1 Tax=Ammoniphilus sp. 3BR4 TaxID=3158265 RepID=UPI0034670F1C